MWSLIVTLAKMGWRTLRFIREFFLNIIVLSMILFLFIGMSGEKTPLTSSPLLVFDLQGSVVDKAHTKDALSELRKQLNGRFSQSMENSLFELVQLIAQAAQDDKIKGLVLNLDNFMGGDLPSLHYVGKYLTQFKKSGKPIYAYGSNYDQGQYYLASFADKIYLAPQGAVNVYGLNAQNLYYKDLIEHLNVNAHIFRVGTYKSAVEPLIRNDMSDEARSNQSRWLNAMWNGYLAEVSANRGLTPETLLPTPQTMIARIKANQGNLAQYALNQKLVDGVLSQYEFWKMLESEFGPDVKNKEKSSIYDYTLWPEESNAAEIAVVFVNGAIVDQDDVDGSTSGSSAVALIQKARLNENVKALILRINSPGGSVQASDEIRQELLAFKKSGKKIVVSMNSMAASGGYWISTVSDAIIAAPNTITGSIGVFGIIPTFEKTMAKIGVYADGVSTSPLAQPSVFNALAPEFAEMMQMNIEYIYTHFLEIVAKARNKTPAEINTIAQGQVWIGEDALKIGLVDQLGDFDDAVSLAAELAQINQYKLTWLEPEKSFFDSLFSGISAKLPSIISAYLPAPFASAPKALQQQAQLWQHLNDPQFSYIYCLNCPTL